MELGEPHVAVNGGHVVKSQPGIIGICSVVHLISMQAVVDVKHRRWSLQLLI